MPSTRTSAKRLRLPAHCLIAKYGRGCRIPVVSRRPMRASRCVVFTLRRCAPPSGWRLDSGDRVVTWRHLDLRAVLRDGKGNLGDWTSSGKALEKRLCLRPLPTADSARRCNTPTARAVFSMLQRPAESETRSGHFRGHLPQQRPSSSYAVGTVPPSITYSVPEIALERGDARKAIRSATSFGLAGRPSGIPPRAFMMISLPPS